MRKVIAVVDMVIATSSGNLDHLRGFLRVAVQSSHFASLHGLQIRYPGTRSSKLLSLEVAESLPAAAREMFLAHCRLWQSDCQASPSQIHCNCDFQLPAMLGIACISQSRVCRGLITVV